MASKQDWLTAALDQLLLEGTPNVKVERLARVLGVTKGSFYWHFKDRDDLLQQAAAHWHATQLGFVHALTAEDHPTPDARLDALLAFIATKDARADTAVRLWARQADWVDVLVADIDRRRLDYCQAIFTTMGFDADAARLRAHLVYYYQVAEQTLSYHEPAPLRTRLDRLRFDLLTSRQ